MNAITRANPLLFMSECLLDCLVANWSLSLASQIKQVPGWQLRSGVDQWRTWLKREGVLFSETTKEDYVKFRQHLRAQNVSSDSAMIYLRGLQDFYSFLFGLSWLGSYPVERPAPAGNRTEITKRDRDKDGFPAFSLRSQYGGNRSS